MILSTVRLAISARHRPEVLRMLRVLMGHATARAGCAGFSLFQDVTNPEALTICDRWVTREDLDEHIRSAEYRLLLAADRLVGDTSGHQLRRSRAHRWPRHRARAASPAANDSGGGVAMIAEAPPTPTTAGGWARAARLGSADGGFFSTTGNIHQSGGGTVPDVSCQRPPADHSKSAPACVSQHDFANCLCRAR